VEEFKERQRATWQAGDYATLSEYISGVGERVVARAGVEREMDVLDASRRDGLPTALSSRRKRRWTLERR
jgi:hypothetical protein